VSVPTNWTALSSNSEVKFVPQNGYGPVRGGQTAMTHGVELGVAPRTSSDLGSATQTFVAGLLRGNPEMRAGGPQAVELSKRRAILTRLEGSSALGGVERVDLYTTLLSDGTLFYYVTVVPDRDVDGYAAAFNAVYRSIKLTAP
jgi:hypothetical protein